MLKKGLGLLLVLILAGCEVEEKASLDVVKEQYFKLIQDSISEGDLAKYLQGDIKLISASLDSQGSLNFYDFTVEGALNEDFQSLSDLDKYYLLEELDYMDFSRGMCGEGSRCSVESITLNTGEDTYVVSPSDVLKIEKNGEYFNPKPTISTGSPSSTSIDSGKTSSNKQVIYEYMKQQFDEITNYGENYVPEIHDPQIAELAANRFGITAAEADQIYIDMEMGKY